MLCYKCNAKLPDDAKFCGVCGCVIDRTAVQESPAPVVESESGYEAPISIPAPEKEITENDIPEQYRPLGAWSFFGLQLLYAVPIVGVIFLIIHSCNSSNLCRRGFARSHWCGYLIVGIIFLVILFLSAILGIGVREMLR